MKYFDAEIFLKEGHRVRYNQSNYRRVYEDEPDQLKELIASEEEPSLSDVVQVKNYDEKYLT